MSNQLNFLLEQYRQSATDNIKPESLQHVIVNIQYTIKSTRDNKKTKIGT